MPHYFTSFVDVVRRAIGGRQSTGWRQAVLTAKRWASPIVIAVIGYLLSAGAYDSLHDSQVALERQRFDADVENAQDDVQSRLTTYVDVLRGEASFLAASGGTLGSQVWHDYASTLRIHERYPGIHGIGIVLPSQSRDLPRLLQELHRSGHQELHLKLIPNVPDSERVADRHYVITHIEPSDQNLSTRGLDMASERNRRIAAEIARDYGHAAITRPITLAEGESGQPGFLLFTPAYRSGKWTDVSERRRQFIGWVYASFVFAKFFDAALTNWHTSLGIRVIASDASGGEFPVYERRWDGGQDTRSFTRTTRLALAGELFTIEWRSLDASGGHIGHLDVWVLAAGVLISLLAAGLLASVQSTARRAEALVVEKTHALRLSEQRFQEFAQTAADWVWELDSDFRFTLNTAEAAFAGYDGKDIIGHRPWDRPGADPDDPTSLSVRRTHEAHRPFRQFVRAVVGADGRTYYARISGLPLFGPDGAFQGYRGTAIDVTASVEAEKRFKHHQERLELALSAGDMAVWDLDLESGILTIEGTLYEKLGYAPEERPTDTLSWGALVHPDDAPAVEARVAALKDGTEPIYDSVLRLRAKNGSWHSILEHGRVVERAADGRALRIVGSDLDVTERQSVDEKLRIAQKMDAIGQLTGGIAHDFNNILMILEGYARRILEKKGDWPAVEFSVKQIDAAVEKAKGLTAGLLSFSRRRTMRRQVFDLDAAVLDMTELLKRAVDERFTLNFELATDGARINTDPDELGQALLNLVVNARDAMSAKAGAIVIGTRRVRVDENHVAIREGLSAGDYVEVYVRDQGCGMDDHVRQHVFEPFFTTKPQGQGTGLGLAMVYGFCRQSEGSVDIDSAVGKGTSIKMLLPVSQEASTAASVEQLKTVQGGRGELVLLIEDDEALLSLVKESLEGIGYNVMAASSGFEALEITQDADRKIDMIVTDIVMPGLSGIELSAILLERYPTTRVVFMSGYPSRGDRDYGQLPEGACFLQKPVKTDELARVVRAQLDEVELQEAV